MKITSYHFTPYQLHYTKPFVTARGSFELRRGFLVQLESDSGYTGVGDAAPFAEFGSETYGSALNLLKSLETLFPVGIEIHSVEGLSLFLTEWTKYPAVRCAMEQAILKLLTLEKEKPLAELLDVTTRKKIPVNGLIDLVTPDAAAEAAERMMQEGYRTVKMKLGRMSLQEDREAIEAVRRTVGDDVTIRLDANGRLTLREASSFLPKLEDFNIEYIEQPLEDIRDFPKLKQYTSIPLAADESVRSAVDVRNIIAGRLADVIVLKPMMMGGIMICLNSIQLALENNITCTVTTSYDSSVGKLPAVFLASVLPGPVACGIPSSGIFSEDIAEDKYPVKNGHILVEDFSL